MAGPSSSLVIRKAIEPLWSAWAATNSSQATTKAAIEVFMSAAPRPYSLPSRWVGLKGSERHCSTGPVGTTSVWPANTSSGAPVPLRAHRLVTPFDSTTSHTKPSGDSRSIRCRWQPLSSGVTEERAISFSVSARVLEVIMCGSAVKNLLVLGGREADGEHAILVQHRAFDHRR